MILELREQKKKGAKKGSGRPLLVFKTVGRNKSVRACGLGNCGNCGRFLGKFSLSFRVFVELEFVFVWSPLRDRYLT